jgi:hypothetical protein
MAILISKSVSLLNYVAFLVLFIFSFIFILSEKAAIFGYVLEFITLTSFLFFILGDLIPGMEDFSYFVPIFATISVSTGCILHFVSLIFVLIMIYKMNVKFSAAKGLPVTINEPYKTQLYNFNVNMITVFCLSTLMILLLKFRGNLLDVNLFLLIKNMNFLLFYKNFTLLVTLAMSIIVVVISSIQIDTANKLAQLTRQQLNMAEYNTFMKNNNNNNT